MNRYFPWLFAASLFTAGQTSHAELQVDSTIAAKEVEKLVGPLFQTVVKPYGEQHSADFGWPYGKIGTFAKENDKFAWIFNGTRLFSTVASFVPEIAPLSDCKLPQNGMPNESQCQWRRTGFKVCHLFMFNGKTLHLESVTRLNIVRDASRLRGLPMCLSVQAMAVAKTVPDAMLITLGYIDSAEPANKHYDPPEFRTTLLLRFQDDHGKLRIEQDDSCLGNPNDYKTIGAARKALSQCIGK